MIKYTVNIIFSHFSSLCFFYFSEIYASCLKICKTCLTLRPVMVSFNIPQFSRVATKHVMLGRSLPQCHDVQSLVRNHKGFYTASSTHYGRLK